MATGGACAARTSEAGYPRGFEAFSIEQKASNSLVFECAAGWAFEIPEIESWLALQQCSPVTGVTVLHAGRARDLTRT